MDGGDGNDTMFGANGTDYMMGGNGSDYLDGRGGNDELWSAWDWGQDGYADTLIGGSGKDLFYVSSWDYTPDKASNEKRL